MSSLRYLLGMVLCLASFLPASAQHTEESVIEFFSTNATMEDDPNKQNYNITVYSPDGEWKVQLNYNSPSMFGTFGNEEFDLAGKGKNYNYARNPHNDMVFYSFTDMKVSVTDEGTLYRVQANCLTANNKRFIFEATIEAPQPQDTRLDDLGYARVEENPFYGTFAIYAENDHYRLSYGIVSTQLAGTFYRADMLKPELYDKQSGQDIEILSATAVHTPSGDSTLMMVDLLSADHVLYRLSMYHGSYHVEVECEINISISGGSLQDMTDMYGCFLFAGAGAQYQFSVAVRPESVEDGRKEWSRDDFIMQYTRLYLVDENVYVTIHDIHVTLEQADKALILHADVTAMDGTLYHITLLLEQDGYMPTPTATVNIDFGHVRVLDYTQGMGTVGIGAVLPGQYQMRAYLYATQLDGDFTTSDFLMDQCDIMVVQGNSYVFHDARYVNASMQRDGDRTLITIDMYGIDDVLYHATMYLDALDCLAEECTYSISNDDEVTLMALRQGDAERGEYTLQFQNLDKALDEDFNIVGDGYYFSFYLAHPGFGVSGDYGYSEGTLAEDEYHAFYEKGCEVRVAPVAGTLHLKPKEKVTLDLGIGLGTLTTYLYQAGFEFLGQNGSIYRGEGENFLLCINEEGEFVNLSEDILQSIDTTLAQHGMRVRKVLRDGKIVIERGDKSYGISGVELK